MPSPSPASGLLDQISVGPPTSSLPREMIDEAIAEHREAEGSREVVFVVTDLDVELEARAPMSGGGGGRQAFGVEQVPCAQDDRDGQVDEHTGAVPPTVAASSGCAT